MSEETEIGTITVLIDRMLKERLPRAQDIQARVNKGECLTQLDIEFLEQVFNDTHNLQAANLTKHPECEEIMSKLASMYKEITEKALENEKNKK